MLTAKESWHDVCGAQSYSTPSAFTFSHRELEEKIVTAGKDISVLSDLD